MSFIQQGTVVLVDDDPSIRTSTVQALELAGLTAIPFSDAAAALDTLRFGFNGVVVSDLQMPHIDGLEFFAEVRKIDPTIPFILMTGHGNSAAAASAIQSGAEDFITKPFSSGYLLASIRRALIRRQLELENRALRKIAKYAIHARLVLAGEEPEFVRLRQAIDEMTGTDIDDLI